MIRFGLALQTFTPHPQEPDIDGIVRYARRAEELGFHSLWAWDHLLLGSKRPFPFLESLTTLAGLATVTERVELGTGVLVLPLRDPVVLAKVTSTLDVISGGHLIMGVAAGWYRREFEAVGVPYSQRGTRFERNLETLIRFWTEQSVSGGEGQRSFTDAVMLPKPTRRPRPPVLVGGYVDRVLRRAATLGDGWLAYFYSAASFRDSWAKVCRFAEEAGRDPATLDNVSQLVVCVDDTFDQAERRGRAFMDRYFDTPEWSQASQDHAIRGTPEQCAEQLSAHIEAGVRHLCLIPCDYQTEQVDALASDVLPKVRGGLPAGAL
jgi:probable F420-dependent oxidoreductase